MRASTQCSSFDLENHVPLFSGHHQKEELEDRHWTYVKRHNRTAKDFNVFLQSAFAKAEQEIPSISAKRSVLGGSPCIEGTRIPVYMILDAVEHYGTIKGALKSYPRLTIDQVRDAIRSSKVVLEFCVEH